MKGRWVKYLLMGTVVAMLAPALPNQPIADSNIKTGNLPSFLSGEPARCRWRAD